jgi:uncharacterized protein HemX
LKGLTVKIYYPKQNNTWSDTRISSLEKGNTGVSCYAGTPGDAEKTEPTEQATEAPTEEATEAVTEPAETTAETLPQETQEQAETEIQETEATQPLPPVQEDKGPDGAVMILFLIAGVIALLCIGLLVWIFLDYRARQKRKKNRKRKAMEWDT